MPNTQGTQMMHFFPGSINLGSFEAFCKQEKLDPKKVIFIFPGNPTHHDKGRSLYSLKGGAGLADVSYSLGKAGYPTMSLPTTGLEDWFTNADTKKLAETALLDLFRALGAGFSFILPVRKHANSKYFSQGLHQEPTLEPSFYGGVQTASNLPLADYYKKHLDTFWTLAYCSEFDRNMMIDHKPNDPFFKAFKEGLQLKAKSQDPVIGGTGSIQSVTNPKAQPSQQFPKSYQDIYSKHPDPVRAAMALLDDYTKGNSWLMRLFSFHLGRNHTKEVNVIVEDRSLDSVEKILARLHQINLVNPNGSLSRRIKFIETQNPQLASENTKDDAATQFRP